MKKNMLYSLVFLFILLLYFSTYTFFQTESVVKTFIHYSSPHYKISKALITDYNSSDPVLQKRAEEEIINITLKGLELEKWQDYLEYIQLQVYEGKVIPNANQQIIIGLNLSKDLAVVAIYDAVGDDYVYHSSIDGLTFIDNIALTEIESSKMDALIIYQTLDERFGGFFYENYIEIYYYVDGDFKRVWDKTILFEETYKEIWIDPKSPEDQWNKIVEKTVLEFNFLDPMEIHAVTSLEKYTAKSSTTPMVEAFDLVSTTTHSDTYYWSNRYHTFVLGEITQDVFISNAAVLKDYSQGRESLYGIDNGNYKLITSKGEIIYLPKKKFQGMFQFLFHE